MVEIARSAKDGNSVEWVALEAGEKLPFSAAKFDVLNGRYTDASLPLKSINDLCNLNNLKLIKGERFKWKSFFLNLKSGDVYFKNNLLKTCSHTSWPCE